MCQIITELLHDCSTQNEFIFSLDVYKRQVYTYTVSDIEIYENTADFKLPATDGKTLVLATCYPFRYSGNAPGKYVITAVII